MQTKDRPTARQSEGNPQACPELSWLMGWYPAGTQLEPGAFRADEGMMPERPWAWQGGGTGPYMHLSRVLGLRTMRAR